jgi:outer membrane usher protein
VGATVNTNDSANVSPVVGGIAVLSPGSAGGTAGSAAGSSTGSTTPDPTSTAADPATGSAAADPSVGETLLLEVVVNGHSVGAIGEFTLYRSKLMARPDELRDLGFRVPFSRASGPGALISLSDLPGVTWRLDIRKLELYVTASDDSLVPTVLQPGEERKGAERRRVIESGTGLTLNYDSVGTFSTSEAGAATSLDLRGFSPWGVLSSEWLTYAGNNSGGAFPNKALRLDTAYTFADVNSLRRYSLGDFITGGLSWTRPIHLEGAQIRSDFSMRPDLVTFPLPSVAGSAAVPSTVSVLTDGNLVVSNQVAPGPFEIPQLPVISGAGTISMTVTNALGQQVTVSQPFYASAALLAPGLQTFAAQSGLVRRNWGSARSNYGKIAGTAMYRRGLTSKFTLEGGVEGTPGTFMAGGGGVIQVGNLGIVNFSAAASGGSGQPDAQFSAGAQRIGRKFSIGASATIAGRNYRDIATMNGEGVLRKQITAFASVSLKRYGSAGIAYGGIDQDGVTALIQPSDSLGDHSHVVSASYSLQFRRCSIFASEYKSLSGTTGGSGFQVGLNIPFRRRSSVNVSATSDGSGQILVQQSAAEVGDWGYLGYISAGNSEREFGEVQFKSPVGLFTAGIDRSSGQTTMRVESQGAISFVDRGVFPSNTIYDSFGVVDTSPVAHVHVLQENRNVGKTNSAGRLLVPDMRSFDLNRIAIVATDIPADAIINTASGEIRPQDRSGVVVKFPVKFSRGALVRLVDERDIPIPLGSVATLQATAAVFPVGYDGEVYVENLSPHNELSVERPDGQHCTIAFEYKPLPGDIPSIGPLRCLELKP